MYSHEKAMLRKVATTLVYLPTIFFMERTSRVLSVRTRTFWGDKMNALLPEGLSMNVALFGYTEPGLSRVIVSLLKRGMTFIDIGAHYGYFTMLASRLVGEEGRVDSFEPTPGSFRMLLRNIRDRRNVRPNNAACSSKNGRMVLHDFGIRYSAFNSLTEPRFGRLPTGSEKEVSSIRLDDYVARNKIEPDFVKIDVESSEFDVLKGMEHVISSFHPVISVEVGDYVRGATRSRATLVHLLKRGYVAYEPRNGRLSRHRVRRTYSFGNIILLPNRSESRHRRNRGD